MSYTQFFFKSLISFPVKCSFQSISLFPSVSESQSCNTKIKILSCTFQRNYKTKYGEESQKVEKGRRKGDSRVNEGGEKKNRKKKEEEAWLEKEREGREGRGRGGGR